MKQLVAIIIIIVMLLSYSSFAKNSSDEMVVSFDESTSVLKIYGKVGTSKGMLVTLSVAEHSDSISFSKSNTPSMMYLYTTQDNGLLSISMPVPNLLPSGKYDAILDSKAEKKYKKVYNFMFVNEADEGTKAVINKLNETESLDAFCKVVIDGDKAEKVGIDFNDDVILTYASYALSFCYFKKDNDLGYTPLTFYNTFCLGIASAIINKENDVDKVMKRYASCFGITYEEYSNIEANKKEILNQLLYKADFIHDQPGEIYRELYLVASVRTIMSWSYLREYINQYSDELEINMGPDSNYTKLDKSLQYKVFTSMYDNRNLFYSIGDIHNTFDNEVNSLLEKQNNSKKIDRGSSRKGNSSKPAKSITVGIENPEQSSTTDTDRNGTSQNKYPDLTDHYAKKAVERLTDIEVVSGYEDGTFRPDNYVTRAEFAKMAAKLFKISGFGKEFEDVNSKDWYFDAISCLSGVGIINGFDGNFFPNSNIIRQDAAVMIFRVAAYIKKDLRGEYKFKDSSQVSEYAVKSVSALGANGIIHSDDNRVYPQDYITRADTAVLLINAYDNFFKSGEER